jgi:Na+-transporting NADH:ubiquinone oxidoreductase subunit NqrE
MNTETITKRGIESALYVCPATVAASRVVRERVATDDVVTPLQGTGLPFAGNAWFAMASVAVRGIQQFVPSHPGDTARRPPA